MRRLVCAWVIRNTSKTGFLMLRLIFENTWDKPFHCSDCGAWFNQKGSLKRQYMTFLRHLPQGQCTWLYIKIHPSDKPFHCSDHGAWLDQKGSLKRHYMTHLRYLITSMTMYLIIYENTDMRQALPLFWLRSAV